VLVEAGVSVLIDATTHIEEQLLDVDRLDAVLLTHAHRDAAGGIPALGRWWRSRGLAPLPLYAAPEAIAVVQERHRHLDHLDPIAVEPGEPRQRGGLTISAAEVPHARERRYRTFAWRLEADRSTIVYASDVARLEPPLERLAHRAQLLVVDGAMWRRSLFSHLTIDRELPALCRWPVERILLTQIGRTAPPHHELERAVRGLCPKASPAWDGLALELG
jgi:phosphoribosyl 1,2-cyclic phosphodiesterase